MSGHVEKLIAALPAKLRDPLTLSVLEEMSPGEVAEVLGIKRSGGRSRLFRARQILRERLAKVLEGDMESEKRNDSSTICTSPICWTTRSSSMAQPSRGPG